MVLWIRSFRIILVYYIFKIKVNGYRIEAYPSNHIDSFRALENPKFTLLDEADFFRKNEQENISYGAALDTIGRDTLYKIKS
jgi:hypothetical protein